MNSYTTLRSVVESDEDFLLAAIPFYADDYTTVLDVTYNQGSIWGKHRAFPIGIDLVPKFAKDLCADNRCLPIRSESVDVIVYDPPHLSGDHATKGSSKIWEERYGLKLDLKGDNTSALYLPFLLEAQRVLKPRGIVLAKVANHVHNHKFQWSVVDLVLAIRKSGLTPCDEVVKTRKNSIISSKWVNAHHARRYHCSWIVARKGGCE